MKILTSHDRKVTQAEPTSEITDKDQDHSSSTPPTLSTRFPETTILQPMTDKNTNQSKNASLNTRVISEMVPPD